ncbi:MAG: hypothetical protein JNJ54_22825 [Myxococcaceae bacterium]|nr:hypothetical protein [Myxococcaceae bacterium]
MSTCLFTRWRRASEREGWEPDLPAGVGFRVVSSARAHRVGAGWALVEADVESWSASVPRAVRAPELLANLLGSAKRFPPALAIARRQYERFCQASWGPAELARRFSQLLSTQLRAQARTPFMLVEAAREEVGYLEPGEFVWALGAGRRHGRQRASGSWRGCRATTRSTRTR